MHAKEEQVMKLLRVKNCHNLSNNFFSKNIPQHFNTNNFFYVELLKWYVQQFYFNYPLKKNEL